MFFSRRELSQLLSLYSRRVMNGEWRDYAIDRHDGLVVFSVFRHTYASPLFAVAKRRRGNDESHYLLSSGGRTLKRSDSLDEVLRAIDGRLRVVT